jgi:glutamyl-tRNA synthetase
MEPLTIDCHIARLGTSDPLEAVPDLQTLGATFDFGKMGRNPARFDPADMARINAGVLHAMTYDQARPRLEALGADLGEAFWLAIRANLALFADVKDWARIVAGPVRPLVGDEAFLDAALALLPEVLDEGSWSAWTTAVKDATGAKGRALFQPLRAALIGQDQGPEMGPLLVLIGRDRAAKRLAGQVA